MKNHTVILFMTVIIGLLLIGDVLGQQEKAPDQPAQDEVVREGTQQDGQSRHLVRVSRLFLIGEKIKTPKGEDLGAVEDLLVELTTGEVHYVVVSPDSFVADNRLMAVPVEAFKIDRNRKVLVLDVGRDVLRNAPSFTRDEWPDMADGEWTRTVDDYYGPHIAVPMRTS